MTKEEQIQNFMQELNLTREEAEQLYADDESGDKLPEVEEMTAKAKKVKRYEVTEKVKEKQVTRERKVDEGKKKILEELSDTLECIGAVVTGTQTETEISFTYEGSSYSLKLIKHRAPKAK